LDNGKQLNITNLNHQLQVALPKFERAATMLALNGLRDCAETWATGHRIQGEVIPNCAGNRWYN
jgi:hypothetical protein